MLVEPLTVPAGTHEVALPADKSLTHRALIFAACAEGESRITNPSAALDCRTTAAVLRQLGVVVHEREHWEIISPGRERLRSPRTPLYFGNSGTTARLLIGLLASLPGLSCVCEGDASLTMRPMGRVVQRLRAVGADICGRADGNYLPLTIRGVRLRPFSCTLEVASAQVKSALLLAAMNIEGEVRIDMPAGTREHTEQMLRAQGIACEWDSRAGRQQLTISGPHTLQPRIWQVAADPSAAAFFVVLGVLLPRGVRIVLRGVLADEVRLAFLRVVVAMGGEVRRRDDGAGSCELVMSGGATLQAVQIEADAVPALIDEVPALVVLALFARGETVWHGLDELRHKESDRLAALVRLCDAAGAESELRGDTLVVCGNGGSIEPYVFDARGDHRLSMAAAIAASFAEQRCELENAECVDISFPGFFQQLQALAKGVGQ